MSQTSAQTTEVSITNAKSQSQASVESKSSTTRDGSSDSTSSISTSTIQVSSRTQQVVTTIVSVSGSSTVRNILTTSQVVAAETGSASSTGAPGLSGSSGSSGSSGLSSASKKIIGGVVGGVGGAILLGGLAVVVWRIWGRKRRSAYEDNDLIDSQQGSSGREKSSSVSGHTPFRSTLDQYHNPAGPVNTASNF